MEMFEIIEKGDTLSIAINHYVVMEAVTLERQTRQLIARLPGFTDVSGRPELMRGHLNSFTHRIRHPLVAWFTTLPTLEGLSLLPRCPMPAELLEGVAAHVCEALKLLLLAKLGDSSALELAELEIDAARTLMLNVEC